MISRDRLSRSNELELSESQLAIDSKNDPAALEKAAADDNAAVAQTQIWIGHAQAKKHASTMAAAQYLGARALHGLAFIRRDAISCRKRSTCTAKHKPPGQK